MQSKLRLATAMATAMAALCPHIAISAGPNFDMTQGAPALIKPSDVVVAAEKIKAEEAQRERLRRKALGEDEPSPVDQASKRPIAKPAPELRLMMQPPAMGLAPNQSMTPEAVPFAPSFGVSPGLPKPAPVFLPNKQATSDVTSSMPKGCENPADIAQMLKPSCLDAISRSTRILPPGLGLPSFSGPAQPQAAASVPCWAVVTPSGGQPQQPMSFSAPTYDQCFAIGAKLTYGIPGTINIVAITPEWGPLAVSCRREATDGGQAIECTAQQ